MLKPEWHIEFSTEGSYRSSVRNARNKEKYIRASISREDIGNLLQGKHITLLFMNDEYEAEGMLDIELYDRDTMFEVSDKLNEMIIQ